MRVRGVTKRRNMRYNTPCTERHKGIADRRTDSKRHKRHKLLLLCRSMRKGKENGDREKRKREYHLLLEPLRQCGTKNHAVCNQQRCELIPEFDKFFSRVSSCHHYFAKPIKLLSQLKYCNGAVIFSGGGRNILKTKTFN